MVIVDRDGLFNGSRWRRCSNGARFAAPYLLLASNGFARLELDPLRITADAFGTFDSRPTPAEIMGWIAEYAAAYLLFPFECDGKMWGQWDCPDRLLPRYKSSADKRSPSPPEPAFSEWRSRYRTESKAFPKPCETFPKNSEIFLPVVVVAGAVEGVVADEKNICAFDKARVVGGDSFSLIEPEVKPELRPEQREAWFETFWAEYRPIRSRARKDARKAFMAAVKTEAIFSEVMAGLKAQASELLSRDPEKRPYAASWLRGERWRDETAEVGCTRQAESISPIERAVETAFEE